MTESINLTKAEDAMLKSSTTLALVGASITYNLLRNGAGIVSDLNSFFNNYTCDEFEFVKTVGKMDFQKSTTRSSASTLTSKTSLHDQDYRWGGTTQYKIRAPLTTPVRIKDDYATDPFYVVLQTGLAELAASNGISRINGALNTEGVMPAGLVSTLLGGPGGQGVESPPWLMVTKALSAMTYDSAYAQPTRNEIKVGYRIVRLQTLCKTYLSGGASDYDPNKYCYVPYVHDLTSVYSIGQPRYNPATDPQHAAVQGYSFVWPVLGAGSFSEVGNASALDPIFVAASSAIQQKIVLWVDVSNRATETEDYFYPAQHVFSPVEGVESARNTIARWMQAVCSPKDLEMAFYYQALLSQFERQDNGIGNVTYCGPKLNAMARWSMIEEELVPENSYLTHGRVFIPTYSGAAFCVRAYGLLRVPRNNSFLTTQAVNEISNRTFLGICAMTQFMQLANGMLYMTSNVAARYATISTMININVDVEPHNPEAVNAIWKWVPFQPNNVPRSLMEFEVPSDKRVRSYNRLLSNVGNGNAVDKLPLSVKYTSSDNSMFYYNLKDESVELIRTGHWGGTKFFPTSFDNKMSSWGLNQSALVANDFVQLEEVSLDVRYYEQAEINNKRSFLR